MTFLQLFLHIVVRVAEYAIPKIIKRHPTLRISFVNASFTLMAKTIKNTAQTAIKIPYVEESERVGILRKSPLTKSVIQTQIGSAMIRSKFEFK